MFLGDFKLTTAALTALMLLTCPTLNAYNAPLQDAPRALKQLLNNPILEAHFLEASRRHKLDPVLLASIAILESSLVLDAYNAKTQDHCMLQINTKTAKSLKLNTKRLKTDLAYCINAGAKVLSWFKRTYQTSEPYAWTCRYNTGTRLRPGKACFKYLKKLDKIQSAVKLEVPNV